MLVSAQPDEVLTRPPPLRMLPVDAEGALLNLARWTSTAAA